MDPSKVKNFGEPYQIKSIPKGLRIVQDGNDLGHFVITPDHSGMRIDEYKDLLGLIELVKHGLGE